MERNGSQKMTSQYDFTEVDNNTINVKKMKIYNRLHSMTSQYDLGAAKVPGCCTNATRTHASTYIHHAGAARVPIPHIHMHIHLHTYITQVLQGDNDAKTRVFTVVS